MIKPTYVTFEQAKVLKSKGFDVPTLAYRQKSAKIGDETILPLTLPDKEFYWAVYDWNHYPSEVPYYSIPEQWQVVEWLRVNYSIWIVCSPDEECFGCTIYTIKSGIKFIYNSENKLTPQEAYSAAFDYVLKNLI
jgi:hypothetical protein